MCCQKRNVLKKCPEMLARLSGAFLLDMFTGVESEDVDNVRHLVAIVLAEASRLSTKSIAIPLMGTGAAGWSLHVVAKALVTEVVETINVCGIGDALKVQCLHNAFPYLLFFQLHFP